MSTNATPFSAEKYFETQPPPPTLEHDIAAVREFVARQAESGKRVVLVTVSVSSPRHFIPSFTHCRSEWWNDGAPRAQRVSRSHPIMSFIQVLIAGVPDPVSVF